MYLDRRFGLNLLLSEITLLFDLSVYLDRTLAQRKAKSKVKSRPISTFFQYIFLTFALVRRHVTFKASLL